ncbi:hypothetical protein NMY22_g7758 [Coprinellus aureogranulatus]|nr:hypothetical protein NMY22_g7758 [Coprinellus aureogranulatus]
MPGHSDPEALKGKPGQGHVRSRSRQLLRLANYYKPRSPKRWIWFIAGCLFVVILLKTHLKDVFSNTPMGRRKRQQLKDLVVIDDTWRDLDLDTPRGTSTWRYRKIRQVHVSNQHAGLEQRLERAADAHAPRVSLEARLCLPAVHLEVGVPSWPREKAWDWHPHTPLSALINGPTTGNGWPSDDPAPRAVNEDFWEVVCPPSKVRVVWTHHVKKAYDLHWNGGKEIFDAWNKLLLDDTAQCIEVIAPQRDIEDFGQVFDLWLWGSDRILALWEELRDSPVSQLLRTSPIIERNIARNEHLFWSKQTTERDPFAHVFAAHGGEPGKNTPENVKFYYDRCLPEPDAIIKKINDARDDYEKEVFGEVPKEHHIHTLFILTNEKGEWLQNFKQRLQQNNDWRIITSSDLVHASAQEKDVAMATDMDLARRSAIFLGNGWSSFTSNILHRRLVDKKIPISNRFF